MIKISREEYAQKFGNQAVSQQPIKISREAYAQKFGEMPKTSLGGYSSDMSTGDYLKGAVGNILPSAGKMLWGLGESVVNAVNPDLSKNTLANVGRLGMGAIQKLDPTEGKLIAKATSFGSPIKAYDEARGVSTDYQPQAEAVGKFYKDRYGGVENIKNSLYEDPTGVALDVATVLSGAGGLVKGAGTLSKSARIAQIGRGLETAGEVVNPLTYAGKATGVVTKPLSKASDWFAKQAESLPTRGMGNPMKIKDVKSVSPVPVDELFNKYNTWDRSPESFQAGIDAAMVKGKELAQGATATGSKVDLLKALKSIDDEISQLTQKAKTSDKAAAMVDELIRRRKMLVDSVSQNGYTPLKVDPSKITEIKQNFQADVPSTQFGQPMSEMNKAAGTKKAYRSLIAGIEEAVPGTKKLGREESALIKLKEIADNQVARQSAKQNINFSRLGGAGLGGLIGGVPGAIQGYVLEQIANSPQFLQLMTKGMRTASKVKVPKTNVFSKLVKGAQINRMVNPK